MLRRAESRLRRRLAVQEHPARPCQHRKEESGPPTDPESADWSALDACRQCNTNDEAVAAGLELTEAPLWALDVGSRDHSRSHSQRRDPDVGDLSVLGRGRSAAFTTVCRCVSAEAARRSA